MHRSVLISKTSSGRCSAAEEPSLDFIQHAERNRSDFEDRKQERDRRQGPFPAGKQAQVLQLFARRLSDNIDARLEQVIRIFKVIEEMDEEMTKRFAETFAQISSHFEDVFRALFGGGRAELKLTAGRRLQNGS